ncbi:hypothetical protein [Herbiconiux sp.]|uniref:hypothetical protein n=1 Tax=Herbiconiux sp. TaxID=1871186 RepID=UPI0025B9C4BB|nr:hypothetical protein [Herbiconiux sp.]
MPEVSQEFHATRFKAQTLQRGIDSLKQLMERRVMQWWDGYNSSHDPHGYPAPAESQRPGGEMEMNVIYASIESSAGRTRTFDDIEKFLLAMRQPYKSVSMSVYITHPLVGSYKMDQGLSFSDYGSGTTTVKVSAPSDTDAERVLSIFIDAAEESRVPVATPSNAAPEPRIDRRQASPSRLRRVGSALNKHLVPIISAAAIAAVSAFITVLVTNAVDNEPPAPAVTVTVTPGG